MTMNEGRQIAKLRRMTVTELRRKYLETFGEPTGSGHKEYLGKRIPWRLQAQSEGGLSERGRRRTPGTGRRHRSQNPRSPHPAHVRLGRGAGPERAWKAPGLARPSVAPARHPTRKRVQRLKRGGEGAR